MSPYQSINQASTLLSKKEDEEVGLGEAGGIHQQRNQRNKKNGEGGGGSRTEGQHNKSCQTAYQISDDSEYRIWHSSAMPVPQRFGPDPLRVVMMLLPLVMLKMVHHRLDRRVVAHPVEMTFKLLCVLCKLGERSL